MIHQPVPRTLLVTEEVGVELHLSGLAQHRLRGNTIDFCPVPIGGYIRDEHGRAERTYHQICQQFGIPLGEAGGVLGLLLHIQEPKTAVIVRLGHRQQLLVRRIEFLFLLVRLPVPKEQMVRGVMGQGEAGGGGRCHVGAGERNLLPYP